MEILGKGNRKMIGICWICKKQYKSFYWAYKHLEKSGHGSINWHDNRKEIEKK